ncbi:MAG: hypothetical protein IJR68_10690 [Fretibacterium sp.]|nr:hypothetical protein [Fretibacterium sp.]
MPLIRLINVINSHDSDSETDAASAAELKNEREERQADVAALWRAIRSLTFDDIHGVLEGERVWATGYRPKP